jgi:hypothetical protein
MRWGGARAVILGSALAVTTSDCGRSADRPSDAGTDDGAISIGGSDAGGPDDGRSDAGEDVALPICDASAMLTLIEPDGSVATCAYQLGDPPASYLSWESIMVYVGNGAIPHDLSRTYGWDYITADYSSIELFGPACDLLTASSDGGIVGDGGTDGGLRVLFLCAFPLRT